jgi:hypothetical protein
LADLEPSPHGEYSDQENQYLFSTFIIELREWCENFNEKETQSKGFWAKVTRAIGVFLEGLSVLLYKIPTISRLLSRAGIKLQQLSSIKVNKLGDGKDQDLYRSAVKNKCDKFNSSYLSLTEADICTDIEELDSE